MVPEPEVGAAEATWTAYSNTLPGKRVGVGCLLFDSSGRLLIVNPTYKQGWSIPGGVVDAGESPYAACRRELLEELGVDLNPGRLVCMDYIPPTVSATENIQLLFHGGTVEEEVAQGFVVPEDELSEWQFTDTHEAVSLLRTKLGKRVRAFLDNPKAGFLYLEGGEPIT